MYYLKILVVDSILSLYNLTLSFFCYIIWGRYRKHKYKNICVHKIGNVGDLICAVPAISMIKHNFPEAKITLLNSIGPMKNAVDGTDLLRNENWIDNIIVYDMNELKDYKSMKLFFKKLGQTQKFDCFINLPVEKANFRMEIKELLYALQLRVDYATGFYLSTIMRFAKEQNMRHYDNEVMRGLTHLPFYKNNLVEFPFSFSLDDVNYIECLLNEIEDLGNMMIVSFNGKGTAKKWPLENFHEIAMRWNKQGGTVIVVGGQNDIIEGRAIIDGLNNGYNFCGRTTLKQALLLVKKVGKVLSIDTGTNHMAAAVGAELITVFSSCYFRDKWFPYGDKNTIIYHDEECSPCLMKECPLGTNKCMKSISVDEVWSVIQRKWL